MWVHYVPGHVVNSTSYQCAWGCDILPCFINSTVQQGQQSAKDMPCSVHTHSHPGVALWTTRGSAERIRWHHLQRLLWPTGDTLLTSFKYAFRDPSSAVNLFENNKQCSNHHISDRQKDWVNNGWGHTSSKRPVHNWVDKVYPDRGFPLCFMYVLFSGW